MSKVAEIRHNQLKNRSDFQKLAQDLVAPLADYFQSENPGRLNLGNTGTVYSKDEQEIEAFLRPLWAIGPLLSDPQQHLAFFDQYRKGLITGTDPTGIHYWGDLTDTDQLMVEEASIALTLILTKERLWDTLAVNEQENINNWLIQINEHSLPNNNWHFFRVLVNMSMSLLGMTYSESMMAYDFNAIDSFYVGKGWYTDGPVDQQDYYVSWALHFYGLVYAKLYGQRDPKRAKILQDRAIKFAQDFRYWFDQNGSAIPYGRSLIYRFAECTFWSGLAYAGVEAIPWGQMKHIVLQHFRYWMKQDIFKTDGILNLGYAYENLNFTEGYNGPGSPYWGLKPFLVLALPEDHPFWKAKEEPLRIKQKICVPEGRMLVTRGKDGRNVQGFTAGQLVNNQSHREAKYAKFVYSTRFGFSTPKDGIMLNEQAYDNTLALCEVGDHHYRTRESVDTYKFTSDYVYSMWRPYNDVDVQTFIIPIHPWHVRVHLINAGRNLMFAEGGFANENSIELKIKKTSSGVYTDTKRGISGAEIIQGPFTEVGIIKPEPNTNLLFPKSVIPTLRGQLPLGRSIIIDAFVGAVDGENIAEKPVVKLVNQKLEIQFHGETNKINLGSVQDGCLKTTTNRNA